MEFGVLGPLLVRDGDIEVSVTSPRQRALLAALLLRAGSAVSSDALADAVWDWRPAGARSTLHSYLTRLRQTLGNDISARIRTRGSSYLIEVGDDEFDALRLRALREAGRTALADRDWAAAVRYFRAAEALFRGEPLADVTSDRLRREHGQHLAESRLQLTEWRVDAELNTGRHRDVIAEVRTLVAGYPLRERFTAQLMLALHRAGRQAEALECYQRTHAVLAEELGIEPGAELRDLHMRILNGDAALHALPDSRAARMTPARPAPAQLPADIGDFTGRAALVREMCGLLATAQGNPGAPAPIIVLSGSGGIGKSSLACHAAHQVQDRFPDGQLYANLRGASGRPLAPGHVLTRFIGDLAGTETHVPDTDDGKAALFRSLLSGRRVLIVLDDARNSAQLRPLLPGASGGSAVIVTSRDGLCALEGCVRLTVGELAMADARQLFGRVIGSDRVAAEKQACDEVLAACAGLPLAIRIAAGRLVARASWRVRDLADRLADEERRLTELEVDDLAVRSCFAFGYTTLPAASPGEADPAAAFRALGLWPGPDIGLDAAAALLGQPRSRVGPALEHLVDAHLLQTTRPGRYRFHDLLAIYAAERGRQEDTQEERDTSMRFLLDWYLDTAVAATGALEIGKHLQRDRVPADAGMDFADHDTALAWCEAERANLLIAVEIAAARGLHDLSWQLADSLSPFYNLCKYWTDWERANLLGLAAARAAGDARGEASMLTGLGVQFCQRERFDEALDHLWKARSLWQGTDDELGLGRTLNNLGITLASSGRYDEAIEYLNGALRIRRRMGYQYGEAVLSCNLAEAYRRAGRLHEALASARRSLTLLETTGGPFQLATALNCTGDILRDLGRHREAVDNFRRALAMRRQIGDRAGEAVTLCSLAGSLRFLEAVAEAGDCLRKALTIHRDMGDDSAEAIVAGQLTALGTTD